MFNLQSKRAVELKMNTFLKMNISMMSLTELLNLLVSGQKMKQWGDHMLETHVCSLWRQVNTVLKLEKKGNSEEQWFFFIFFYFFYTKIGKIKIRTSKSLGKGKRKLPLFPTIVRFVLYSCRTTKNVKKME